MSNRNKIGNRIKNLYYILLATKFTLFYRFIQIPHKEITKYGSQKFMASAQIIPAFAVYNLNFLPIGLSTS